MVSRTTFLTMRATLGNFVLLPRGISDSRIERFNWKAIPKRVELENTLLKLQKKKKKKTQRRRSSQETQTFICIVPASSAEHKRKGKEKSTKDHRTL